MRSDLVLISKALMFWNFFVPLNDIILFGKVYIGDVVAFFWKEEV